MTTYDDTTDLPVEKHPAPEDIVKATPLIVADGEFADAKVKIMGGMSELPIQNPPAIGDERTYIVKARCTKHLIDRVNDEDRLVCEMTHSVIYDRALGPFNDGDPNQGALFDGAGDVDDDE